MNWEIVLGVIVVLLVLRFLRANLLVWMIAWWTGLYVIYQYGFATPIPQSAVEMYVAITTLALAAYVLSSEDRKQEFWTPIRRLILEPRYRPALVAVVLLLPVAVASNVYRNLGGDVAAPFFARTVHPSPPTSITVNDESIDLIQQENPYWHLRDEDPEEYRQHVENGRRVYFENCLYCHGDGLGGDGMFAHGLSPIPTNFTDANVLPNFRSTFFFWRIAKGAPGMPEEGGPWESAMPEWERFLTNQEIWEVITFLYDFSGYSPRAKEEHGG